MKKILGIFFLLCWMSSISGIFGTACAGLLEGEKYRFVTSMEELLKGVTEEEKNNGFFTNINSGVKINSLDLNNGILKIDFDDEIEFQVGGSCRVTAIRAQIIETLKQFSTVKEVIISVNGRVDDILQP